MAIVVAAFAIAVIAGVIKGAVGFAMPLVMVSGFSSIMDPKVGLAILIVPVVISNVMQTFRNGVAPAWDAIIEFRRYLLIVCIAIIVAAQAVNYVSDQAFYAVLGVPVVALSVLQLLGWRMQIKPENRNKTEWGVGLLSGIVGGLAFVGEYHGCDIRYRPLWQAENIPLYQLKGGFAHSLCQRSCTM